MDETVQAALGRVSGGIDLSQDEARAVIRAVMAGQLDPPQMALLLVGLHRKGETVEEIAGAAAAMRDAMRPIATRREGLVDTCGTGGDRSGTFNISTAAALVAAAAGVPVAKHGNRRVTGSTGSADVLSALGVNVEADVACVERCLDELGICFCFAPLFHQSMRHVAEVRRQLDTATIFNLLGPLTNPARAPYQVIGVGWPSRRHDMAEALARLGTERAVLVSGEDGLDEVTLSGTTHVSEVRRDANDPQRMVVIEHCWQPEQFGISRQAIDPLLVETPAQSAAIIRDVLAGRTGAARDIVVLNAAAALWVAGRSPSLEVCAATAAEAIDRGEAQRLLARLVETTNA